jgi:general stress protein 26
MGLYFATAIESPKVRELELNAGVNVSMQDKRRFVSVTGEARVILDRNLVERLWSESWTVWFPMGKSDPTLCMIVVEPSEAAYWDMTGTEGISYLIEMAQAYVTGTKSTSDDDDRHVGNVEL